MYATSSEYVSNNTIRTLLSDVSKHFDPIGLIAPVLEIAKVTNLSCWKLNLEWNDAITDIVSRAYTNLKNDMGPLTQIKIHPKVLPTHLYNEVSLQVFCDASENAYGACVYPVSVKEDIISSILITHD